MLKLNAALALVLLICAIAVVSARHQARKLFVELQQAQAQARALDIEWGRLLLEQSTWAMHSRVEVVAQHQLHMAVPDAARIHLLLPPETVTP
jgi:cell division protein FtsL